MAVLTDLFDAIYVINLPARQDRRVEMQEQLVRLGLGLDAPGIHVFPAVRPDDAGGFPSLGARGCFLSHLGVLEQALAAGQRRILILEDDVDFAPDLAARWPGLREALTTPAWSVFYGGYEVAHAPQAQEGMLEWPSATGVRTTHFIAFQGPAIAAAVDYLRAILGRPPGDPAGGPMHVDGAYSRFRKGHPDLRTLLATPQLGFQRASRTDIHALRWYDRLFLVRTFVAIVRRAKNLRNRARGASTGVDFPGASQ